MKQQPRIETVEEFKLHIAAVICAKSKQISALHCDRARS